MLSVTLEINLCGILRWKRKKKNTFRKYVLFYLEENEKEN
jgi:hypothetical protein